MCSEGGFQVLKQSNKNGHSLLCLTISQEEVSSYHSWPVFTSEKQGQKNFAQYFIDDL